MSLLQSQDSENPSDHSDGDVPTLFDLGETPWKANEDGAERGGDGVGRPSSADELMLSMAAARLRAEIAINTRLVQREQERHIGLVALKRQVLDCDEPEQDDASFGDSDDRTMSGDDRGDAMSIAQLRESLLAADALLEEEFARLRDTNRAMHQLEDRQRSLELHAATVQGMLKVQLQCAERWAREAVQREQASLQELEEAQSRLDALVREEEALQQQLVSIRDEYDYLSDAMARVIELLRGKQELPTGRIVTVTSAIELFSELKAAVDNGTFSAQYFLGFLADHPELHIESPAFMGSPQTGAASPGAAKSPRSPQPPVFAGDRKDHATKV